MTTPNVPEVSRVDTSAMETPPKPEPTLPSEQQPQGEKLFAGKYKTVEAMEQGYKELEKKLGQKATPPAEPTKETPPAKQDPLKITSTPEQAVAAAGLDFEAFNKEFQETGELTAESYAKLEKAGIPKVMVDSYIAGQQAVLETVQARVFGYAGGQENYQAMLEWAASNLDKADIEAFNAAVARGPADQKFAVDALYTRYKGAVGSNPNLLKGGGAAPDAVGYASRAEMVADMKDPRYQNDPAYRAKVQAKIAKTTSF